MIKVILLSEYTEDMKNVVQLLKEAALSSPAHNDKLQFLDNHDNPINHGIT